MKFIPVLGIILCLFACSPAQSGVKEYVKNSDSASIEFYNKNGQLESIIIVHDRTSVEKLGECMDGKNINLPDKNENGKICFYEKGNKKMNVDFCLNGETNSFTYSFNDKIQTTSMNEEATKYMMGIREISIGSENH